MAESGRKLAELGLEPKWPRRSWSSPMPPTSSYQPTRHLVVATLLLPFVGDCRWRTGWRRTWTIPPTLHDDGRVQTHACTHSFMRSC